MSLVLKSNMNLEPAKLLDNLNQQPLAYADFRNGQYNISGQNKTVSDIVTVTQPNTSGVYDALGLYSTVAPNTARVSVDRESLEKGLLIEGSFNNVIKNPQAMADQTITLTTSEEYLSTKVFFLTVVGSGSVTITVPTDGGFTKTATQGNPVIYRPKTAGTMTANLTVSGLVDFATLTAANNSVDIVTRKVGVYADDKVTINQTLFNSLQSNGTVIMEMFLPKEFFPTYSLATPIAGVMQLNGTSGGASGVVRLNRLDTANGRIARFSGVNSQGTPSIDASIGTKGKYIVAISYSKTSASCAINGNFVGNFNHSFTAFDALQLGGGSLPSPVKTIYIQQLAILDSQLSKAELEAATSPLF